jgi:hypothetical protein
MYDDRPRQIGVDQQRVLCTVWSSGERPSNVRKAPPLPDEKLTCRLVTTTTTTSSTSDNSSTTTRLVWHDHRTVCCSTMTIGRMLHAAPAPSAISGRL